MSGQKNSTSPSSSPSAAMGWAPLIGRLFGIEIRVHITFLVLLAFLGLAHWLPERSLTAAFIGVSFFAVLFLCVSIPLTRFTDHLLARERRRTSGTVVS
jgi:hypothetical protein